ncbi:MAG: class I SAM-dependent methyltransferase [Candidatus Paceibacterota bacterium]
MDIDLKQYNPVVDSYSEQINEMNKKSNSEFRDAFESIKLNGVNVVEFGCGAGDLISYIKDHGLKYSGIDSSEEMINSIKQKFSTDVNVKVGDFTKTTFTKKSFDLVFSKWAIQTIDNVDLAYKESVRLLKDDGFLLFLVVHPIRHFLEKKKKGKNYFTQELVESVIFSGTITVREPSHTVSEYFSDYFLQNFNLLKVHESYEFPGAEQINGDIYPTHLLYIAQKK